MQCQMTDAIKALLWEAGLITRLYSWVLVLSLSFLVGQLLGYGIAGLSGIPTGSSRPLISSPNELPKWRQGSVNTAIGSNTSNASQKGTNHGAL